MFKYDKMRTLCLFVYFGYGFSMVFLSPWFGQLKYFAHIIQAKSLQASSAKFFCIVTADLTQLADL